jgi:ligand-binding SRPBCC domain-containing protein
MPVLEATTDLRCPPADAFEFLAHPANLLKVTPPELHAELIDAPERLSLGARITVQVRRFGIPQTMVSEVTAFAEGVLFTDEQRQGPFGKFAHAHRVEPTPTGCRITDRLEFEPPGGMLGLVLTAKALEAEMKKSFAYREQKFKELLDRAEA